VGLQLKVVVLLLLIGLAPLAASAFLIDQIAEVAQNFASHEASELRAPLERSTDVVRRLIESKKALYHQAARTVAHAGDPAAELARIEKDVPELLRGEFEGADGVKAASVARPAGAAGLPAQFRELRVEEPVPGAGGRVVLVFAADESLLAWHEELGRTLDKVRRIDSVRAELPRGYRLAFLFLVGGVVVVAVASGVLLARRYTRRIADLVSGTRKVADGDLGARVGIGGRDELGELAGAFNRMVEDIENDREQILYLQRIGAWQDVARRLAHEIKNPLTPIQLAVQQLVSSYDGSDPRHKKMLADAAEIVGEEIASLRRLVDAFSALGRLPPAEPKPLDLAVVADDLGKDPGLAAHLETAAPTDTVTVAGDRMLLRRLLANLVENGIQAGGGGAVRLAWEVKDGERFARVTVDDAGPGVPAADRERIFEPYVTSKETGTGLGLAIAKKIAFDHGGDLELAEEASPLGGARFVLTVPLAQ
jgi:nitrogen fixation/metabolism regulation signal transduction histidine kinase